MGRCSRQSYPSLATIDSALETETYRKSDRKAKCFCPPNGSGCRPKGVGEAALSLTARCCSSFMGINSAVRTRQAVRGRLRNWGGWVVLVASWFSGSEPTHAMGCIPHRISFAVLISLMLSLSFVSVSQSRYFFFLFFYRPADW